MAEESRNPAEDISSNLVNRRDSRGVYLEADMAYAVFEGEERLTRIFATEQEAWDAAECAGLVEAASDGKSLLEDHLEIRFCTGEPQADEDAGADFKV